jgi:hypothetical protein
LLAAPPVSILAPTASGRQETPAMKAPFVETAPKNAWPGETAMQLYLMRPTFAQTAATPTNPPRNRAIFRETQAFSWIAVKRPIKWRPVRVNF